MLYRSTELAGDALDRPVVAIGNFDGVHRGHAKVIERAVAVATERGVDAAVLTFEPHPVLYFRPQTPEFRLTTLEQKAVLLTELGVRAVVAALFDADLASLSPDDFVQQIVVDDLAASAVLVGTDFRFGKGRTGDVHALQRLGERHAFDVLTVDLVRQTDHDIVSSTRVRSALADGELDVVARLLGRPYAITGTVEHGDHLGRTFGFPTANIDPHNPLLPPDGIYATRLFDTPGGSFDAATYVGTRPAVGGTGRVVEAYCLDAPDVLDLYGHEVELEFVARVRGDQNFDSHNELIEQMHRDVADVRRVLSER